MDRSDFRMLRDLPDKVIKADIRFSQKKQAAGIFTADGIEIENSRGISLKLNIRFDPEIGSKSVNVVAIGVGPICRLDVDGPAHRPAGRSHKHSLQTERCPDRNVPDEVIDKPEFTGMTVKEVFSAFCVMAKITHDGTFTPPSE
jgi:hypothetical protein